VQRNTDIWLLDGVRTSRFTFDAAPDLFPLWSPDGSRIVFDTTRAGSRNLYVKPSDGAGREEMLLESPRDKVANDWSPDGKFLLYTSFEPGSLDLWVLPLDGDRRPWVFLNTKFDEGLGQFSPDGHWVAYMSNESGRYEIYVRPFVVPAASGAQDGATGSGGLQQVSTAGGIYPRWRRDGKELYYIDPNGQMMAAPIAATGTTIELGTPGALFRPRMFGGGASNSQGWQYDVARDGRFLINIVLNEAAAPITLLQNWKPPAGK
jgi:Tol biopolymer transport system component